MHLPDINVWLALAFTDHEHHPAALKWFEHRARADCALCRFDFWEEMPSNAAKGR